jgi:transposase
LHGVAKVRIEARLPARLAGLRDWAGRELPPGVQGRVLAMWRVLQAVEAERQAARRSERHHVRATAAPTVGARLARLRGIAARTATVLAHELFVRELHNRRHVGALTGLVSAPYASGTTRMDQGLARTGIPAIRRVAVEIAWAWLRFQPRSTLSQWYHTRFASGGAVARRIGIVAVARRLMIALWRYVTDGVIPEGAQLKASH